RQTRASEETEMGLRRSAGLILAGGITLVSYAFASDPQPPVRGSDRQEGQRPGRAPENPAPTALPAPYEETIAGTKVKLRMVPVPPAPGSAAGGFWISATELPWEAYDPFVYGTGAAQRREEDAAGADAISRPSKPYIPPDHGFGHDGYPAICISFHGAREFCRWLSAKTGQRYRLPAEDEWEHACRAGTKTSYSFGDDPGRLAEHAWFRGNADHKTHAVAKKMPNPWGLFDMHGNVAEWCVGADGKPVARGGSYRDKPEGLRCDRRLLPSKRWQASDPQIPKSRWWLSDAPFIGFRIVREFNRQSTPEGGK
ncbi:MAG: formylglycine-generating enzyme family protein, partial [Planctomycetota bacterium]